MRNKPLDRHPVGFPCRGKWGAVFVLSALVLISLAGCAGPQSAAPPSAAALLAGQVRDQAERLTRAKNWDPAIRAWQEAADRYALLHDRTNQAAAQHRISRIYSEQGDLDQAHRVLSQTAGLYPEAWAPREWWTVQIELAQLETSMGRQAEAGQRLDSLATRASSLSDPFLLGTLHNETGLMRQRQNRPAEADVSFRNAEKAFSRAQSPVGLAAAKCNRAQLFSAQGQAAKALPLWSESLRRYQNLGDAPRIAYCLLGRGETALQLGIHLEDAERDLRLAVENYRLLNHPTGKLRSLTALAECLRRQNKTDAAEALQNEILREKRAAED